MKKNGAAVGTYTYDSTGMRIKKTAGGVTPTYHVMNGVCYGETRSDGRNLQYVFDENGRVIGFRVQRNGGSNRYYFVFNAQGDVVQLLHANGNVVANYTYDTWGRCTVTSGTGGTLSSTDIGSINPFRYRGYYYDTETGLYYLQSRYYDPVVGRFLNADSAGYLNGIEDPVTFNLFFYCNNNPVSYADYNGELLTAVLIGVAIGAIVGGLAGYGLSRILKVPKGSRWKYVLGGAVIGAVIGGCIGYAVGAAGSSGIVLWSGGGMNGAGGHAMNFAAKNGLRTLEMTTKGKLLTRLNSAAIKVLGKSKGYSFMKPLWNAASRQFVKSTVGRQVYVNVFISASQFSEASVFAKIEYEIVRSLGMKIIWHFVQ